jgi:hypothetical protein
VDNGGKPGVEEIQIEEAHEKDDPDQERHGCAASGEELLDDEFANGPFFDDERRREGRRGSGSDPRKTPRDFLILASFHEQESD